MVDLHCHLLPGLDDGPTTTEDALALARAFVADGTTAVAVTPHVSWTYPQVNAARIAEATTALTTALADADIPLTLHQGAEIAIAGIADLDDDLDALTLGTGSYLLVEPPFSPAVASIQAALDRLLLSGRRLVLAHPERSPGFAHNPDLLRPYVDVGVICQVTAGSLTGTFGRDVQRAAQRMLNDGLIGILASDAHDVNRRPPALSDALRAIDDDALGHWLAVDMPTAVVNGTALPPRPSSPPTVRRRWHRRAAR